MHLQPLTLTGRHVRLEPLSCEHTDGLWAAGSDPALWRYTTARIASAADMRQYLEAALAEQAAGTALPFCTVEQATNQVVGTTRFGNISLPNKRAEIGWTFVTPRCQRSPINTEAKYLMFRQAFEVWGLNRVELKTGSLNTKSRTAMLRIGCKEEGTLRRHMIHNDGFVRDTVYYSVIAEEWPEVKAHLERLLERDYR